MTELLKIQYANVYIQIPADENFLESLEFVIDCLEFMKQHIKIDRKKVAELTAPEDSK